MTDTSWEEALKEAIRLYIEQVTPKGVAVSGTKETPERVVRAYAEYASGWLEDPKKVLQKTFDDMEGYDEMIVIENIPVLSTCQHHIAPILGRATFGYLPMGRVVGLSKIPRLCDILARRLQVQERLTQEIVHTFQSEVGPRGCGCVIRAFHCCMSARGVRVHPVITTTTALDGCFTQAAVKAEFLDAVPRNGSILV